MKIKILIKNFIKYLKNNMKKIITFLLIYFVLLTSVFAETKLELNISDTKINIDDYINLELKVTFTDSINWDNQIIIKWIENFTQFSKQNSSNFSSINWVNSYEQWITLSLKPNSTWNFVIWPAIMWTWSNIIKSNIINLDVFDENITGWDELIVTNFNLIWKINFLPILLLFIIIYFYFRKNKAIKPVINKENTNNLNINQKIISSLNKLKENQDKYSKTKYYELLNNIFRQYFKVKWYKNTDNLTLKEIKKLAIDKEIITIFEKSYLNEFSSLESDKKERLLIVEEFIIFLNK